MRDDTGETYAAGDGAQGFQDHAASESAEPSAQGNAAEGGDSLYESADHGRPLDADAATLLDDAPEPGDEGDGRDGSSFELPEGVEMDQSALDAALPVMAELNLDHAGQQKLVTLYAEMQQQAQVQAQADLRTKQEAWRKEIAADPGHAEKLGAARQALQTFGDEEFETMVKTSWLGDHPATIRFLARIGESLKDDAFVEGSHRPGGGRNIADVMFGDMINTK